MYTNELDIATPIPPYLGIKKMSIITCNTIPTTATAKLLFCMPVADKILAIEALIPLLKKEATSRTLIIGTAGK